MSGYSGILHEYFRTDWRDSEAVTEPERFL